MIIVYGKQATLNSDHVTLDELKTCFGPSHIFDDKSKEKGFVIITFESIVIQRIKCQCNILIISPNVSFDRNAIVDMSTQTKPKSRPENQDMDFYGLPGFPGLPGYNLSIYSQNISLNHMQFLSLGSEGGEGQKGTPPGKKGERGKSGLMVINNKITINPDNNTPGIINDFGIHVDIGTYKQIIYQGIIEFNLTNDKQICTFFNYF